MRKPAVSVSLPHASDIYIYMQSKSDSLFLMPIQSQAVYLKVGFYLLPCSLYTPDLSSSTRRSNISCEMFADGAKAYKNIQDADVWHSYQLLQPLSFVSHLCNLPRSGAKTKSRYLESVDSLITTGLGFILDAKRTLSQHCELIASEAGRAIHIVSRCVPTNSVNRLRLAYISYARPLLECSRTVFSPSTKRNKARLEAAQSNFTRKLWLWLYGYDYSSIQPPMFGIKFSTFLNSVTS